MLWATKCLDRRRFSPDEQQHGLPCVLRLDGRLLLQGPGRIASRLPGASRSRHRPLHHRPLLVGAPVLDEGPRSVEICIHCRPCSHGLRLSDALEGLRQLRTMGRGWTAGEQRIAHAPRLLRGLGALWLGLHGPLQCAEVLLSTAGEVSAQIRRSGVHGIRLGSRCLRRLRNVRLRLVRLRLGGQHPEELRLRSGSDAGLAQHGLLRGFHIPAGLQRLPRLLRLPAEWLWHRRI
mmetsp:Transcript_64903/g.134481  ORF Transcript_64903/g.134481 Transcript_64903/m.134481 type:complete len:234 (+) Transcript_64903:49-750(+)